MITAQIVRQMSNIGVGPYKLGLQNPHRQARRACASTRLTKPAHRAMASLHCKELATAADTRPDLPRSGHCAAGLPNAEGDVLVFGGYTETPDKQRAATNDAWRFSSSSQTWSKVQYAASSQGAPEPRITAQLVQCGGRLWLIGGWNPGKQGPEAFLSDVWSLDPANWAWTQHQPQGESLQGISRFQAVPVGDKIYIHTHRNLEDIYVLHTNTSSGSAAAANSSNSSSPVLEKVAVAGPGPSSRGLHSLVACGSSLYLFGGAPQHGPMLGDLWQLDLSHQALAWKQLQPEGPAPHVRCSTIAAALDSRHILYFGGAFYGASGGLEMLGDAVLLDTQECRWVTPSVSGQLPSPRNAAAGVAVPLGGSSQGVLMYGGWKALVESYNDTFLLSLS